MVNISGEIPGNTAFCLIRNIDTISMATVGSPQLSFSLQQLVVSCPVIIPITLTTYPLCLTYSILD